MCNFIVGLVTPDMLEHLTWGTYIFFAAFAIMALIFTYYFVPETRGKSLEDMDVIFGDTAAHEEKVRLFNIASELSENLVDGKKKESLAEQVEMKV